MNITRKRSTGNLVLATLALTGALAIGQPSLAATETAIVEVPAQAPVPLVAAAGNGSTNLDTRGRFKTEAQADEAVRVLLAAGADINARDRGGQTALHGAASWGYNTLVRTLVANKVELTAKDAQGRTAADIAKGSSTGSGRGAIQPHPDTEALLRGLMSGNTIVGQNN